jgi:predicted aspartyl protease
MSTIPVVEIQGARAENVPAVILEDWGGNVDALLGLSFLSRFTIKMDPGSGQLVLTARK